MLKKTCLLLFMLVLAGCSSSNPEKQTSLSPSEIKSLKELQNMAIEFSGSDSSLKSTSYTPKDYTTATQKTLDFSSIDSSIPEIIYDVYSEDQRGTEGGASYSFSQYSDIQNGYKYVGLTAVDHNYEGSASYDPLSGIMWYQNIERNEINPQSEHYKSIIVSYHLPQNTTLAHVDDGFLVKKTDGEAFGELSSISLGSKEVHCEYLFEESDGGTMSIRFESCPITFKARHETEGMYEFNASYNDFVFNYPQDFADAVNTNNPDNIDCNSPDWKSSFTRFYNTSGDLVGYFKLNFCTGKYQFFDTDKRPIDSI